MNKEEVVLVGGGSSLWMCLYIKETYDLSKYNLSVILFEKIEPSLEKMYVKLGVNLIKVYDEIKPNSKWRKGINLITYALKTKFTKKIKYIELHNLAHTNQAYFTFFLCKIIRKPIFINFWGSDLLRLEDKHYKYVNCLVKIADLVNLQTYELKQAFEEKFPNYNGAISNVIFGTLGLEEINNLYKNNFSKLDAKKHFGFEGITIAVGHNGSEAQQHEKVLEQLSRLPNHFKSQFQIILHMYMGEVEYIKKISDIADSTGIPYIIIDKKLDLKNVALLRMSTDIFIHAQITDLLASSIREILAAEGILINGSWLNYEDLKKNKIDYLEFDNFDEINPLLITTVSSEINVKKNREVINKLFSWDSLRYKWSKIRDEKFN